MAKYTSGRQKNIKVGLTSYSENRTSLEVVGKVGIGTTNATSSLHIVGDQNVTGISTLGAVKISSGIITSSNPGVTTVTFVGNLTGTATTAGFAFTAFKLEGFDFDTTVVGFATTATNVIGGIASVTDLKVTGFSTFGNSTSGILINPIGIITSNTGVAITFIGNLTGTASTASFATTAFNVNGGIATVSDLRVTGFSTVGVLTATKIGIGTTNPTSELVVIGDIFSTGITTLGTVKISSGIVTSTTGTAVTYFGDLKGNSDTTGKLKNPVNIGGVPFDGSSPISLKGVNTKGDQDTDGTAASANNLTGGISKGVYFRDIAGNNVTTSNNLTFDGNNLKVSGLTTAGSLNISGISTFGVSGGTDGVVIKTENGAGIITSSNPGFTTVTYYGTLIGTAQVNVENVTNTSNVIGGIASVTDLKVTGFSTFGNSTSGILINPIGIITSNTGVAITFVGNLTGTATTAGFAQTAFGLETQSALSIRVGFATTARDVIGGIGSLSDLIVSGISTFGNASIGIKIDGTTGIITSNTGTAVTFFGNLTGTATTAGFARTAFGLETQSALSIRVGFATTARDVIGGIGSLTDLKVTGISTFGTSSSGVVIKTENGLGIITSSSPGVGTVTYFGNLTGTASTASFATKAFNLEGFTPTTGSVGFATTATNLGAGNTGSLPYQNAPGITSFLSAPGTAKQILIYDLDNNKPKWGNVSEGAGFASFGGITVREEGADVGTASSITVLNFVGGNIVAIANSGANGIATITMSDNLVGTALSITGISTFGNTSIGIKIDGTTGIITSNTGTAVTFFGNLTGTATTSGFAVTAFNLDTSSAINVKVGFATTARDVIGGIGSLTDLKVTGISTFGTSSSGVVIKTENGLGIITSSSPGVGTVTYFGDGSKLTGIKGASVENQTSTDTPVFLTLASNAGVSSIGISTTNATALSFTPSTGNLGIGTTSASQKLWVNGNAFFGGTGIVTAVEYNGNLKFGTPTGTGFKAGAVAITTVSNTKDAVNEINFILGKLVPKAPATIDNRPLSLNLLSAPIATQGFICDFSPGAPVNNDPNTVTPTANTVYSRNTDNTISTLTISQGNSSLLRGPGNSGTVTALLNFGNGIGVGVGTVTLTDGSNNGTFGNLVISSDQDAVVTGITSGFYEVYDASVSNAICSDGFNSICIRHVDGANTYLTTKAVWYEDGSIVSSPILTKTTPITPPSPDLAFSSGVPHYTESTNNGFAYIISCENATGDMYRSDGTPLLTSGGQTAGFLNAGNKTYTDFFGGTNPPARNFGVGTAVTCLISQRPRSDVHTTVTADTEKFSTYTAATLYGTGTANTRATITQSVNIMGTSPSGTLIRESNITVTNGTSGIRVGSGSSSYDTPVPVFPTWVSSSTVPTHEAVIRGGVLRHDVQNYSTGFLPVGPDYSVGRSGSQYFQVKFVKPQITSFNMTISGRIAGCWVCLVDSDVLVNNKTWVEALTGNGNFGWGNMFQVFGSGVPTFLNPGCASAVPMANNATPYSNATFTCTFGQQGSGSTGTILVRWKLDAGQTLTSMTFTV